MAAAAASRAEGCDMTRAGNVRTHASTTRMILTMKTSFHLHERSTRTIRNARSIGLEFIRVSPRPDWRMPMKTVVAACLTLLAAVSSPPDLAAQDLVVTNARILDGKGGVIERGSVVVQ